MSRELHCAAARHPDEPVDQEQQVGHSGQQASIVTNEEDAAGETVPGEEDGGGDGDVAPGEVGAGEAETEDDACTKQDGGPHCEMEEGNYRTIMSYTRIDGVEKMKSHVDS